MAHLEGDFLVNEDLDDFYFLLNGRYLHDDVDSNVELDSVVSGVATDNEM